MKNLSASEPTLIRYFSSSLSDTTALAPHDLEKTLPMERPGVNRTGDTFWTYGRYFEAIEKTVTRDSFACLLDAVQSQLALPVKLREIREIRIYAEKHGNWYHPAKIALETTQGEVCFAMNVALHERGRAAMVGEVRTLRGLAEKYAYPWVPQVYSFTERAEFSPGPSENNSVAMFLTDWFAGYDEFHLSVDPADGKQKLILWDGSRTAHYLTNRQSRQVYRLIAKILTSYYDIKTYEQIFPWHHGAGDFVVRLEEEKPDVRLVTVRRYGALVDPSEMGREEALLFFFLNLSIRIRLDRLDGTGDMAWAEDDCLPWSWQGFKEALQAKEAEGLLARGGTNIFLKKWRRISEEALIERFLALLNSYDPQAPDLKVITPGLAQHILRVYDLIKGQI